MQTLFGKNFDSPYFANYSYDYSISSQFENIDYTSDKNNANIILEAQTSSEYVVGWIATAYLPAANVEDEPELIKIKVTPVFDFPSNGRVRYIAYMDKLGYGLLNASDLETLHLVRLQLAGRE